MIKRRLDWKIVIPAVFILLVDIGWTVTGFLLEDPDIIMQGAIYTIFVVVLLIMLSRSTPNCWWRG